MERPIASQTNLSEHIKAEIATKIERAKQQAIAVGRLDEIQNRLDALKVQFVQSGQRTKEQNDEEDELEREILESCAVTDTIPEFKETLHQIATEYGLSPDWVIEYLAHENAHSSVAAQTGHETTYAALFIKNEHGQLSNMEPVCLTKANLEWGPREMLTKNIEVTEAPMHYDNKLSDADIASIARDKALLAQIKDDLEAAS